ncbi:MAG: hypothetical protein AAGI72_17090 [Pseudomonadota bacterium]
MDENDNVWSMLGYFSGPSATLKNIGTGEELGGGIGCMNFEGFRPVLDGDAMRVAEALSRRVEAIEQKYSDLMEKHTATLEKYVETCEELCRHKMATYKPEHEWIP